MGDPKELKRQAKQQAADKDPQTQQANKHNKRRKGEKEKKRKREREKRRKREQPGGLGPQDLSIPNGKALEQMPQRRAESPIQPTEAPRTQQKTKKMEREREREQASKQASKQAN